eukprot:scaffold8130_cov164-Amphora_coffeaeformis.AAC.4
MRQFDLRIRSFQGFAGQGMHLQDGIGTSRGIPRQGTRINNKSRIQDGFAQGRQFRGTDEQVGTAGHVPGLLPIEINRSRKEGKVTSLLQQVLGNACQTRSRCARIGDTMHTAVVTAFTFDVFHVGQAQRPEFKVIASWQIGSLRFGQAVLQRRLGKAAVKRKSEPLDT